MKLLLIALSLAATAAAPLQHHAAQLNLPLHLTGALVSAGGVGNPTGTARVELRVTRWSTQEERTTLVHALTDKGEQSLLHELQGARPVGSVRFNTELAWDLRYARQFPREDGGTRVFLATDRPMGAWEIWNVPRYSQYPFTLIDLQFDPDGGATGSVMLAARVTADPEGRFVNVENFATEAIPISDIHREEK